MITIPFLIHYHIQAVSPPPLIKLLGFFVFQYTCTLSLSLFPPTEKCPDHFYPHQGLCYSVLSPATPTHSLSEAIALCVDNGGGLAYPETMERLTFLEGLVKVRKEKFW